MSGADDQRGAEDARMVEEALHCAETGDAGHWPTAAGFLAGEVYRLRAELAETRVELVAVREERGKYGKGWRAAQVELAETRDRRDYLQGQLDIIYDAEYSRNDALKRRIEKLGTAGDALADQAVDAAGRLSACGEDDMSDATLTQVHAWRSVRGDAPTQPPAGRGPCRDCPPPGQFEIVCGFCGEEVPTLAQVQDGLVEWPTDEEQLRDGQARVRLGEHGIEIVPDAAAPAVARTDGQPPAGGGSAPASTDTTPEDNDA